MASAGLRLICINSTSFKAWRWSQRSAHTSPLVEPKKRNRNQSRLLQHLETGRRPYKQARNMSKQVAHWISGSSPILFINLHHRDLVQHENVAASAAAGAVEGDARRRHRRRRHHPHLIIVADAVSVNFSARCKFSRQNAKIYHFTECIQCTMCVIYANVSLL